MKISCPAKHTPLERKFRFVVVVVVLLPPVCFRLHQPVFRDRGDSTPPIDPLLLVLVANTCRPPGVDHSGGSPQTRPT